MAGQWGEQRLGVLSATGAAQASARIRKIAKQTIFGSLVLMATSGNGNWQQRTRALNKVRSGILFVLLSTRLSFAAELNAAAAASGETELTQAIALDEGTQRPRDAAAAAEAYRAAAAKGSPLAQFRLGYLYETGDGVPHDPAVARKHYEAAVTGGLTEARLRLAICHLEGWGGPVDREAFVREVRVAAEAGYVPAQRILSSLYALGFVLPLDREESVRWLERAAEQDDAMAQVVLGQTVESVRGLTLSADKKLARTWYQLSAEQEYGEGMRAMARTFLEGKKSDRNWVLGRRWLELAAEAADPEAPYILAISEVLHVDAPRRDYDRARQWLKDAAARGHYLAKEVLDLEQAGKSLPAAMTHVLSVPFEQRYIDQTPAGKEAEADGSNHPPVPIHVVKPTYPESLRLTGIAGEAIVQFVVDDMGQVTAPEITKASHPLFGDRALEAVRQWRFRPGKRDGQNVSARMQVPLIFNLSNEGLTGVDGLILAAQDQAKRLGSAAVEDAVSLSIAVPVLLPPYPRMPDGSLLPDGAAALLMLVIDAEGHPLRGYILDARPEAIGPVILSAALAQQYRPRVIEGQGVTSSVLIPLRFNESGENLSVFRQP